MLRVIIVLAVLTVVRAVPQNNEKDCMRLKNIFPDYECDSPTTSKPPLGGDDQCETNNGTAGVCVLYYICDKGKVATDGRDLIDIRVNNNACPSYLDVCCIMTNVRDPTDPVTPPTDTKPQRQGCGWRNPDGIAFRIAGDEDGESKFGEFPWMVAVLKMEPIKKDDSNVKNLMVYVGGGSLIHPSAVLTAAHYVATSTTLKVRAGEWDTQTNKEIYPHQNKDVSSVAVHQDFNKGNLFYDIAILFLASPMELAPNVGVVCLPPPSPTGRVPGGVKCVASGWGKDKFGKEGTYQVILKKVEVTVVEHRQCQTALRKTRLGPFFRLHTSFMCAGGEQGKDTCKGDGGSPLVCPIEFEKDRYMQSGIVAWGIGCGGDGTPGVYVDVSHLRKWVDEKIAGMGLDTTVYTI